MSATGELPALPPRGMRHLLAFEVRHAVPAAWGVLRARLGWSAAVAVLGRYVLLSAGKDPLPKPDGPLDGRRRMARRQFRSALLLDRALEGRLEEAERLEVVAQVVAETGAIFIDTWAPFGSPEVWNAASKEERDRFAHALVARFFNADVTRIDARPGAFDFDIGGCRFAELAREMGRP